MIVTKLFLKVAVGFFAVVFIAVAVYIHASEKIKVGIQDDHIYYKMSSAIMLLQKGKPVSKESDRETLSKIFEYEEEIYGLKCETSYSFYSKNLWTSLKTVTVIIPIQDEKEGRELFNKIHNDMLLKYQDERHFFDDGVTENDESGSLLSSKFGTNNGATGIRVYMTLDKNQIVINAHNQY